MSRSPHGAINKEWGRKHRKEEDRLRGLNNRGRHESVREGLLDSARGIDYADGGTGLNDHVHYPNPERVKAINDEWYASVGAPIDLGDWDE